MRCTCDTCRDEWEDALAAYAMPAQQCDPRAEMACALQCVEMAVNLVIERNLEGELLAMQSEQDEAEALAAALRDEKMAAAARRLGRLN
jgi:hypothetical protein